MGYFIKLNFLIFLSLLFFPNPSSDQWLHRHSSISIIINRSWLVFFIIPFITFILKGHGRIQSEWNHRIGIDSRGLKIISNGFFIYIFLVSFRVANIFKKLSHIRGRIVLRGSTHKCVVLPEQIRRNQLINWLERAFHFPRILYRSPRGTEILASGQYLHDQDRTSVRRRYWNPLFYVGLLPFIRLILQEVEHFLTSKWMTN